jgi:molybdopterin converting factor small subunit
MAQLAYNNKLLEAISTTLYFANYRTHLNLFTRTLLHLKAEAVVKTADKLRRVYLELYDKLLDAQEKSYLYVNKKRKTAP